MILEGASKTSLIRAFSKLTLHQIIESKYPSIARVTKLNGIEKVEKVVALLLFDLSASFSGELNKDSVEELTIEISSSHLKTLSFEDLYLAFRDLKKAKNFGKLNVNKVLKALDDHQEKRSDTAYEINYNKHLSEKYVDNTNLGAKEATRAKFAEANLFYAGHLANKKQNSPKND
jgi:hypothetical protein